MKLSKGSAFLLALVVVAAVYATSAQAFGPYAALYGDTVGGLGGETHSRYFYIVESPYTELEVWVLFLPDATGMYAGEFKLNYPSSTDVIRSVVTSNPLNDVELGHLDTGMSFTVSTCQYSWYWSHKQVLVVKTVAPTPLTVSIAAHPGSGHLYVADCTPGFPAKDATVLSNFAINHCFQPSYCTSPLLGNVEIKGYQSINAIFEYCAFCACGLHDFSAYFALRSTSVPPDTIPIISAVPVDYENEFALALGEPMVDGTAYVLEARDVYNCECHHCFFYRDSQFQFTFDAGIGTRDSSWGAIKSLFYE